MADGTHLAVRNQGSMLPANLAEASQLAQDIADSRLFGCKTREEAMGLMLLADAEGLHPAAAARDYHIIEGRPSLKADAMLARFQASGGSVNWIKRTDQEVTGIFSHDKGGDLEVSWTWERASKITTKGKALTAKDNWRNYPCQMLTARCISEGVRAVFPGVVAGLYTPEEVADFTDNAPAAPVHTEVKTERPAEPQQQASKANSRELFEELQKQLRAHKGEQHLLEWGKKNKPRIELLPDDWKRMIFDEYGEEMRALVAEREAAEFAAQSAEQQHPEVIEGELVK